MDGRKIVLIFGQLRLDKMELNEVISDEKEFWHFQEFI